MIHSYYGHVGVNILQMFKEKFTGNKILKSIKQLIKNCDKFQKCKPDNCHQNAEMTYIVPEKKGNLVAVDFYGPLQTSLGGEKYIWW